MSLDDKGVTSRLEDLAAQLRSAITASTQGDLTSRRRRAVEVALRDILASVADTLEALDPIRRPASVFDPSNPKIIGRFVALALIAQRRVPLGAIEAAYGSGVYAIYYRGDHPLYQPIRSTETPIYVGMAAPEVSNARTSIEQGDRLTSRLLEHARSISKVVSLDIRDFECRYLAVQSGYEASAENYLINLFRPIWNIETGILYGLGKHGDSAKTRSNKRSPWDSIHPGRKWAAAESLVDAKTPTDVERELRVHFAKHPPYSDIHALLDEFVDELRQS